MTFLTGKNLQHMTKIDLRFISMKTLGPHAVVAIYTRAYENATHKI